MSPKTMSPTERAKRLVDTSKHMTIATVDVDGVPWVSPVFYVADDNYNLYWVSGRTARHSENIRRCPKTTIAIVIFEADPVVDAVYMSAEAEELTNRDEVDRAIQVLASVQQPEKWVIRNVADVTDDRPWRIYRAIPQEIYVRLEIIESEKTVVVREPADFRVPS